MSDELKHTPMPWSVGIANEGDGIGIRDAKFHIADLCPDGWPQEIQKANADFIVLAVNSHEALVEAAKIGLKFGEYISQMHPININSWEFTGDVEKIKAALAAAGVKP